MNDEYSINNIEDLIPIQTNEETMDQKPSMLVVSNYSGIYGAAGIYLNKELREAVYMRLGEYYILPSSVHETICVPKDTGTYEELSNMVISINDSLVDHMDQLSDSIMSVDETLNLCPYIEDCEKKEAIDIKPVHAIQL